MVDIVVVINEFTGSDGSEEYGLYTNDISAANPNFTFKELTYDTGENVFKPGIINIFNNIAYIYDTNIENILNDQTDQ